MKLKLTDTDTRGTDAPRIPTYEDMETAVASTKSTLGDRARYRDGTVNLLLREWRAVTIYSATVAEPQRGQGHIWAYLALVERCARRQGFHAIHLDGILLTERMRAKAVDRGYTLTGTSSAVKVL